MATPEQKRSVAPILWVTGLAVVIAVIFTIRVMTREIVYVRVAPVSFQTLTSTVATNGKVEPIDDFQAHSPIAGVIQKIYVTEGQHVAAGNLLVSMDDSDARARVATAQATFAQAQLQQTDLQQGGTTEERGQFTANVNTAKLEQQSAQKNLQLEQMLQQKGSASASEVAAAQQRLSTASLALQNASTHLGTRYSPLDRTSAQARVTDARTGLEAAQSALQNLNIRSPIAGTVYYIARSQYDFVPAGDDLMDVADLNRIQVRAYFDEPEIGKLANGQPVSIVWDAKPDRVWHGHIAHAPTTIITYGTRNVGECIITVDDAREDLLPNTNVTVTVTEMKRADVLSIPREALHTDGARNFVFRIVDHKLQQTPVQLGPLVTLLNVEIVGGLKAGDTVVLGPLTPGRDLTDGMVVKSRTSGKSAR